MDRVDDAVDDDAGRVAGAAVAAVAALSGSTNRVTHDAGNRSRLSLGIAILPTLVTLVYEWTTGVTPADWIRALGKRMLKFDFKAYSIAKAKAEKNEGKGFNVPIGEGDENWPEIIKALAEVGYDGWATAEVSGGGEKELRDVAERMNKCLGLAG